MATASNCGVGGFFCCCQPSGPIAVSCGASSSCDHIGYLVLFPWSVSEVLGIVCAKCMIDHQFLFVGETFANFASFVWLSVTAAYQYRLRNEEFRSCTRRYNTIVITCKTNAKQNPTQNKTNKNCVDGWGWLNQMGWGVIEKEKATMPDWNDKIEDTRQSERTTTTKRET